MPSWEGINKWWIFNISDNIVFNKTFSVICFKSKKNWNIFSFYFSLRPNSSLIFMTFFLLTFSSVSHEIQKDFWYFLLIFHLILFEILHKILSIASNFYSYFFYHNFIVLFFLLFFVFLFFVFCFFVFAFFVFCVILFFRLL